MPENAQVKSAIVASKPFVDALVANGIVPRNCRRALIDTGKPEDGVVTVYYECYGDEELLDQVKSWIRA